MLTIRTDKISRYATTDMTVMRDDAGWRQALMTLPIALTASRIFLA